MVIWKYVLSFVDEQSLPLPATAKVLSVQMQREYVCLWVLLDPNHAVDRGRTFAVIGTGNPIEVGGKPLEFIGTVQIKGGALVFHVFEIDPPKTI